MPSALLTVVSTAGDDFLVAYDGAQTIDAGAGDDYVLADIGNYFVTGTSNSFVAPQNVDNLATWTIDEDPFIANATTIPHVSIYVLADAALYHYSSVTVGAGQTITIDIDFGAHVIGNHTDSVIYLYDSLGVQVALNDDAAITLGGAGSTSGLDSFLTFTNATGTAQTYTIRFSEVNPTDGRFGGGEDFIAEISVTGHAVTAPTAMGADVVHGGSGEDTLAGQGGNDALYGEADDDTLFGGSGNDALAGGDGDDFMDGGSGVDVAFYAAATGAVRVNLGVVTAQATGVAGSDTLIAIENVIGSNFNDTLTGNNLANAINGNGGGDVLYGGAGNDTLTGGEGNDALDGGAGNDVLTGGNGVDVASFAAATGGVYVYLDYLFSQNTGAAGFDTLTGIENLSGSSFGDSLTGNSGANAINGNAGNDSLTGGLGNDVLNGGGGIDIAFYAASAAAVSINLGIAAGQNTGGEGIDTLVSIEQVTGSNFNDTLVGNSGANYLHGLGGNDLVNGRAGNDILFGGDGSDSFRFDTPLNAATNVDTLLDYNFTEDSILLSSSIFTAIGAGTLSAAAFQLGTAANDAGDRIIFDSATGRIYYDADGNGAGAQIQFAQVEVSTLVSNLDFIVEPPAAATLKDAGGQSAIGLDAWRAELGFAPAHDGHWPSVIADHFFA